MQAMPRPAPRVAPATRATVSPRGFIGTPSAAGGALLLAEVALGAAGDPIQPVDLSPQPRLNPAKRRVDLLLGVLAPVGPPAVGVGEAVLPRQLPRAGEVARVR